MGVSAGQLPQTPLSAQHARDEFFDKLASQLEGLRNDIGAFAIDPSSVGLRDGLIERLRSLAASATKLEHTLLSEELHACQVVIRAAAVLGELDDNDKRQLDTAMNRIEAYGRAEREREVTPTSGPVTSVGTRRRMSMHGVLRIAVVASSRIVDGLRAEDWAAEDEGAPALEVERLHEGEAKHIIASRKPDVVVIDTELNHTRRLIERLMADPSTDSIPIIATGKWNAPEDAAAFVALGVARCLAQPATPSSLRNACIEVGPNVGNRGFEAIGETTLDGLGVRLADELHRGLCDAATQRSRSMVVDLGEGEELLTALWDALGRIRQLVTAKSQGAVRFQPTGPGAAVPIASWLDSPRGRPFVDRATTSNEVRRGAKSSLEGYNVLVAEDDLSMNWFLSGVFREAGANVSDAFDGEQALDRIYRTIPDLVVSDVVMPGIDGFALCRALKRDVVLRSVPVLLMSWKDDLLQRMRELGAGADGYIRKEASGEVLLQRVQELLRPQHAVAERIAKGGVVRGRLDGITAHALLKMVCRLRPDARVIVRDAHFVHEIVIRYGRPVCATRTSEDGATERGTGVIIGLLGAGGGRFSVEPVGDDEAVAEELEGDLNDQLRQPIALARAAQGLLTGSHLLKVERVALDRHALALQIAATPEPSRGLMRALMAGASPRKMISAGRASAELIERVLMDAARHGAVQGVTTSNGEDVLAPAFERELAIVEGRADRATLRESHAALTGGDNLEVELHDEPPADMLRAEHEVADATPEVPYQTVDQPPVEQVEQEATKPEDAQREFESSFVESLTPSEDIPVDVDEESPIPQRLSLLPDPQGHTPMLASGAVAERERRRTPIISSAVRDRRAPLAELDPDPPAPAKSEPMAEQAPAAGPAPGPASGPAPSQERAEVPEPRAPFTAADVMARGPDEHPKVPRLPMPSNYLTHSAGEPPKKKGMSRFVVPLAFGVVGVALAIGARWYREHQPTTAPPPPAHQAAPLPPAAAPPGPLAPNTEAPSAPAERASVPQLPEELPLSDADKNALQEGQGLLEVVAGRNDKVFVDGKLIGKGPVVKVPLQAGPQPHEIRVKLRGEERVRYATLKAGVRTRIRIAPPWSR
jgi:DNA-binding response OmpR family regulator